MNLVLGWIPKLFGSANYTLRNYSVFLMIILCIQYIPIESRAGVSWVKVTAMVVTIFIYLRYIAVNKMFIICTIYLFWIYVTAYCLHPNSFRASTVIYLSMYVLTFMAFYTFVWEYHVFSLDFFIRVLRNFIFVLVCVLVIQQCCLIVGIRLLPIINLCLELDRGIGANSLTFEPSTLGRLLNVLYYAYLKCNEYKQGSKIGLQQIFTGEHKLVSVAFVWATLTMGSGTAFIALAITSLYFMRGRQFLLSIPIFIGLFLILDVSGNQSFERAVYASQSAITGDSKLIMETDGSAAVRILPIVNTLKIDWSDIDSWIGEGCDSARKHGVYSKYRYMGQISDYGLISYLLELLLIFSCSIRFASLGTIMFFLGVGGGVANVSYGWGLLMIFSCVKYFYENRPDVIHENIDGNLIVLD